MNYPAASGRGIEEQNPKSETRQAAGYSTQLENKKRVLGMNKIIQEVSQGEFIAVHHSDDFWESKKNRSEKL
jgi:hypothetical protein